MIDINITLADKTRVHEVDFNNLKFGRTFSDHIFICDFQDGEWKNARIEPFHYLDMHPASLVLHYGQAIFEGMKAYKNSDGEVFLFRPEENAKRFQASAHRMAMAEVPEDLFVAAVEKLVAVEREWIPTVEGGSLYIRPFQIASDEFIGVQASQSYKFIVFCCPVGAYYPKPLKLWAERKYIRAANGGSGEAKAAGNYATSLLPTLQANKNGYDQVLWLDAVEHEYVQEVGTMNIFFVLDGKVITPATDGSILKGITRKSVLAMASAMGYDVEERPIKVLELFEAHKAGRLTESFGAGTAAVILKVASISDEDHCIEFDLDATPITDKVKSSLVGMQKGEVEDTFGWVRKVRLDMAKI